MRCAARWIGFIAVEAIVLAGAGVTRPADDRPPPPPIVHRPATDFSQIGSSPLSPTTAPAVHFVAAPDSAYRILTPPAPQGATTKPANGASSATPLWWSPASGREAAAAQPAPLQLHAA